MYPSYLYKRKMLQNSVTVLTERKTKRLKVDEKDDLVSNLETDAKQNCPVDGELLMPKHVCNEDKEVGTCTISVDMAIQPLSDFTSTRELCIHLLQTNGLLGSTQRHVATHAPLDVRTWSNSSYMPCKICGLIGNPAKMLICDLCEEAFHLHCCGKREPFSEYWFCQPCFEKKPMALQELGVGNSFADVDEECRRRMLQRELGPILFMLHDTQPHASRVRIGSEFQAEVQDWSSPISNDGDSFGEPSELMSARDSSLEVISSLQRHNSVSNWIQCKEENGNKVICGKWRRAPLSAIQTDDWDCSCAVTWDPIHADCAVPQELETGEVLKQLKYLEAIKSNLDKK